MAIFWVGVNSKTKLASNIWDLLSQRGLLCAVVDLDWLCQMDPAPEGDRYNQLLMFANLAAIWPCYEAAGVQYFVLARVVRTPVIDSAMRCH
jgi:hypothetical protein